MFSVGPQDIVPYRIAVLTLVEGISRKSGKATDEQPHGRTAGKRGERGIGAARQIIVGSGETKSC